jgi:glycolate oxidase FAD binding subunit
MKPLVGATIARMDPALRQIAERIRAAAAERTMLRIRGGGTKDFYGEPPRGEPLSTGELQGLVSYEPSELVVTVLAGTPLAELEAALAAQGQCLPFEPLLSFGGQVMKNVAGYDVSRVLAGSLGVLGLITEVSLKVLPLPPAEATLVFDCHQADALRLLNGWGGQPLPLNASRWTHEQGQGRLWLRLRGATAAVAAACTRLGGERQDDVQARSDWEAARDLRLPWFDARQGKELWRLSVPQTAPVLPLEEPPLIEWHGGQRWYQVAPGEGERLREAARSAGGHATLFMTADGAGTATRRFDALSAPLKRIHEALMREFDPHAVFDRARLFPTT